jgi:hypothetical protein
VNSILLASNKNCDPSEEQWGKEFLAQKNPAETILPDKLEKLWLASAALGRKPLSKGVEKNEKSPEPSFFDIAPKKLYLIGTGFLLLGVIIGHNPLSLLHDLLSEGIHELTDGECLNAD